MQPRNPNTVRIAQILIVAVILLACVLGLLVWQKVTDKNDAQKDTTTFEHDDSSDDSSADTSLLEANRRQSRNAQRKNDVSRLMAAVLEYSANNNGTLPAMIFENQLRSESLDDTPTDLPTLSIYSSDSISIATGEVEAVDSNKLILALEAVCSPSNGAIDGTSRSFAAVYGLEGSDGTYTSTCEES